MKDEIRQAILKGDFQATEVREFVKEKENEADILSLIEYIQNPNIVIEKLIDVNPVLAGKVLTKIKDVDESLKQKVIDKLVEILNGGNYWDIEEIFFEFFNIRLIFLLRMVFCDEEFLLNTIARDAINIIRKEKDINKLLLDLKSSNSDKRIYAAGALGLVGEGVEVVNDLLQTMISDPDGMVRLKAEFALNLMYDKNIAKTFMELLKLHQIHGNNKFFYLTYHILMIASRVGDINILLKGVEAKEADLRDLAINGLAHLNEDRRAIKAIIKCLNDENEWIRKKAESLILFQIKDRAIEPLIEMSKHGDETIKKEALRMLGEMGYRESP